MAIVDLEERMNKLERRLRDIETDWTATYDKFHRLNMRIAKRVKAEEERAEVAPEPTNGPEVVPNPLAQQLLRRGRL